MTNDFRMSGGRSTLAAHVNAGTLYPGLEFNPGIDGNFTQTSTRTLIPRVNDSFLENSRFSGDATLCGAFEVEIA